MQKVLNRYNPWWTSKYKLDLFRRERFFTLLKSTLKEKDIVFLTGLRRVGKTSLMKLLIEDLINIEKINKKHIFYISLDDYLLKDYSIIDLIEEFRKTNEIKFEEKIYLFLDEIAEKEDFTMQLKNIYDSQNVKVFASSSSATILKTKKSYLTGRHKTIEILPLDFEEYLTFKDIKIKAEDEHLIKKHFENFMQTGGIPEFVLRDDIEYLKELVDDIIFKDIAAVHNIKHIQVLKDLFLLLMERVGKQFSINKLANILGKSPDTIRRYIDLFKDTFLIYTVDRCGKTNERLLSRKKIYAADLGIKNLFTGFRDLGSIFENYVFLKIKSQKPCYIYEDGYEIDFKFNDTAVEVKYFKDLEDKQRALLENLNIKNKFIIKSLEDLEKLKL